MIHGLQAIQLPSAWRQRCGRHVYFIQAGDRPLIKIGQADDAWKRIWNLQPGCPDKLVIVGLIDTDDAPTLERYFHARFSRDNVRGEWFNLTAELQEVIDANSANFALPLHYLFHSEPGSYEPLFSYRVKARDTPQRAAANCVALARRSGVSLIGEYAPSPSPVVKEIVDE